MFKFKSREEIAHDITDSYDDDELFERYNNYLEDGYASFDEYIHENDDEFLSAFTKEEIANYASYKYRFNDPYVRATTWGFESADYLRNLIDDDCVCEMIISLLMDDDAEFQNAYDDYLESLANDDSISIQDWVENIIFYNDSDSYDKKCYGIDSSAMIVKKFTEHFSTIYNRSNQKAVQYATKVIKERTDIFSDDFIEKNL